MNTLIARCLAIAIFAILAGCASFGGPRDVDIPLERLQRSLDRHFPVQQRVLAVFDVQLSQPRIGIENMNDRVQLAARMDVTPILGRQSWQGNIALSGRLVVDNARNAVFLHDARIDNFTLNDMDARNRVQLSAIQGILADTLVRDVPLYNFRPDELRYMGTQYLPTSIRTTPQGLLIHLEPERR
ncbi:DUF1439 domain-containing protein [Massilia endophytica]|uniref:DUF1439 domain-containing protein n=1 Tax=Massilia endophytica TaxID=2899220 RepID=UPI001E3B1BA7|nr:DUF1439 domain-containing protein [Massilia endophytica]UGQ48136.1 DUF1439 domain-containing protein [Massilia endophytica]